MNKLYKFFGGRKQFSFYLMVAIITGHAYRGNDPTQLASALFLFFSAVVLGHTATDIATIIKSKNLKDEDKKDESKSE